MNKKNINDHIANFLDYYVCQPDPRYAVMLTGPWGCGKTFFVKRWKEELEKKIKDKKMKLSTPIYISLFGLTSIQEINEAITREIYPFMKSKLYKGGKKVLNAVSKISLNCDLSPLSKSEFKNNPNELNIELDLVSLFKSDSNKARNNKIIIFDDFERCKVDAADMLGYINQFVEHSNIRVILVCHEKEVVDSELFIKFKEKLIGRTFQIEPDIMDAVESFCENPVIKQLQLDNKQMRLVRDVFGKVGYYNLRSLYQALQDFAGVFDKLDYNREDSRQKERFERLLIQYIVAYCEYPMNDGVREIASFEPSGTNLLRFDILSGSQNEDLNIINNKYKGLAGFTPTYWVFDNPMSYILHSIVDGRDVSKQLEGVLHQRNAEETIDQKISRYLFMENGEFNAVYSEAKKYIVNQNSDIITIIQVVSSLISIENKGIRFIEEGLLEESINNIFKIVSNWRLELQGIQTWKELQFDRIMTEINQFSESARLKNYGNDIKHIVENRIIELKESELKGLQSIDNTNFDTTIKLYFLQLGELTTPRYVNMPIFNTLDPESLVKSLCKLSNENKMKFRNLLLNRYEVFQDVSLYRLFNEEIPNLEKISRLLSEISKEKDAIDKWAIYDLSNVFQQCANLIKSDEEDVRT